MSAATGYDVQRWMERDDAVEAASWKRTVRRCEKKQRDERRSLL